MLLVLIAWLYEALIVLLTLPALHRGALPATPGVALSLAFLAYTVFLLFTSLLFSLNALLLNPDLDLLLVAPRPVAGILGGRMVVQAFRMFLLSLLFTIPALVILALDLRNPVLLIVLPTLYLVYPVLPVVVISVITLLVVRFVPVGRSKEVLTAIGLAVALGINLLNFLVNPALNGSGFARRAPTNVFLSPSWASAPWLPPAWAGRAAAGALTGDWPALAGFGLLLLTLGGLLFAAGVWASGRLYLAGWIQAVPARTRRAARGAGPTRPAIVRALPALPPVTAAMIAKDWRMRTRDIAQLARFVMPLVFLLALFGLRAGRLLGMAQSVGTGPFAAMIGLAPAWLLLLSLSNGLGLTAVSLEGKSIWIYRASPNGMGRFLEGKVWSVGLPTTVLVLAIGLLSEALIGPGWPWALAALVFLTLESGALIATMVAIGSLWARFDWTDVRRMLHPGAAIIGLMVELGVSIAIAALSLGGVTLASVTHLPEAPVWLGALTLAALATGLLALVSAGIATERLRGLEVL